MFMKKHINLRKILKYLFFTDLILLFLSELIVICFIIYGDINLGHLPKYGDTELISKNNFDRQFITFGIITMIYCFIISIVLFIVNILINRFSRKEIILFSIVIIVYLLVTFSPSFEWILD